MLRGRSIATHEALRWSRQAQDAVTLRYGSQVRPIITAPDLLRFLGDEPTPEQVQAGMRQLPPYLSSAVIHPDGKQALIAFGIKLQDIGAQRDVLSFLRSALPPPPPGLHVDIAGLPVAAAGAYDAVSADRYAANLLGILTAASVLVIGLRHRWDAARAVLATVFAAGWGLAGTWVLGASLTPLSLALGSLTAAGGCEFAVLLSTAYRNGLDTLRRSVCVACLTSAIGFAVLAVASDLWILRQFGLLLTATVTLSYLAGVVVRFLPPAPPKAFVH